MYHLDTPEIITCHIYKCRVLHNALKQVLHFQRVSSVGSSWQFLLTKDRKSPSNMWIFEIT